MVKILIAILFLSSCGEIVNSPFGTETTSNIFNKNQSSINMLQDDGQHLSFALLADSHQNTSDLDSAVKVISTQKTDFVIHLGDFTDLATNLEYDIYLESMSKFTLPWFTTIGNHDAIGKGKELFKKHLGAWNYYFEYKGFRFIIFNNNALEFDKEGLEYSWLNAAIDSSSLPVLIFQHIDSFNESAYNSTQMKQNAEYLDKKNVLGVFNGHRHVFKLDKYGSTNLIQIDRTERVMYSRVEVKSGLLTVFRCKESSCVETISYPVN